jgi:hypothetical protein
MELDDSGSVADATMQLSQAGTPAVTGQKCLQCSAEIDPSLFSFEMRLIDVNNFCRRCWDGIISDKDMDIPYLEHPKWLKARPRSQR